MIDMADDTSLRRVALATGVELDVVDVGPREAPVLIFLHGFPESHRTWRHQIAHLAGLYRCIAPDQRGYRGSSKPEGVASYRAEYLIADVFALADALGVARFTVIGHDWGGALSWGVALGGQGNGRVERLVIANAPHPYLYQKLLIDDPAQRAAAQYITAFRDPANDALIHEHGLLGLLSKVVDWERAPVMEPEEREALLTDWQDREAAFAMLNWYRAAQVVVPAVGDHPPRPSFLSYPFPNVSVPTLVIWADEDQALLPSNLDGLDDLVTDLEIVRVRDCGHFVPWEAPAAVNAALDKFLSR